MICAKNYEMTFKFVEVTHIQYCRLFFSDTVYNTLIISHFRLDIIQLSVLKNALAYLQSSRNVYSLQYIG